MMMMMMNVKKNDVNLFVSRIFYAQLFFWIIACKNIASEKPLFLPEGFEATVFVDSISETVRHMAVNQNGDLFAKFKLAYLRSVDSKFYSLIFDLRYADDKRMFRKAEDFKSEQSLIEEIVA